jgi:RNA polymerase sigma factor (sigma-70 family)
MRDFFLLYAPLLRDQARKMSIPSGECRQLVETLLDDVAIHLSEVDVPPRELAGYLVTALRNRARNRHRNEKRHRAVDESAYGEYGDSPERIVAECHSEYGMRIAQPTDADDDVELRSAIAKLADKSASELSQQEITMMVGIGRHIPLRDLAEQLGVTYGAARVRLSRLRERFLKLAIQYIKTLEPREKRELERFFRRADVRLTAQPDERLPEHHSGKATANISKERL